MEGLDPNGIFNRPLKICAQSVTGSLIDTPQKGGAKILVGQADSFVLDVNSFREVLI